MSNSTSSHSWLQGAIKKAIPLGFLLLLTVIKGDPAAAYQCGGAHCDAAAFSYCQIDCGSYVETITQNGVVPVACPDQSDALRTSRYPNCANDAQIGYTSTITDTESYTGTLTINAGFTNTVGGKLGGSLAGAINAELSDSTAWTLGATGSGSVTKSVAISDTVSGKVDACSSLRVKHYGGWRTGDFTQTAKVAWSANTRQGGFCLGDFITASTGSCIVNSGSGSGTHKYRVITSQPVPDTCSPNEIVAPCGGA